MATLQDIADHLHIAKGTVSKALNDAPDVSEALKKQVCDTAVALGYVRKRRVTYDIRRLCILIENMDYRNRNDFGRDIIIGFRQMAEPAGFDVDVIPLTQEMQNASSFDVFMIKNRYEGAFFLGYSIYDAWYDGFKTSLTPAVFIDNYIQSNPRVAFVGVDSLDGINQAVTYLKEAGHKKIGYLTTGTDGFYTRSRYQAYQTSLTAAGFSFDPALVGIRNPIAGLIDECFPSILEAGATAVLCSYDEIAVSLMKRCRELKIRVPEQLAVIGFDDLPAAQRTVPPLTTIHQDRLQLGKTGFYALSCLMNQVSISTILLHPDLIVRGSTGPRKMEENL